MRPLLLVPLATFACAETLVCNGAAELCDRRYDEVSYATAHNAMSSEDDGFTPPNQGPGLAAQLEAGLRGFMLDTYEYEGVIWLCHGNCGFGRTKLADALAILKAHLDAHPGDVVTLQLEAYVTGAQTAAVFEAAGLLPYVHTQTRGQPWPTLRAMAESGRRLVVFAESGGGDPGWYHALFDWSFDTPYAAKSKEDLKCTGGRGDAGASLFTVNHFLSNPFADRALAATVNANPGLLERVRACEAEASHRANFVAVDFADASDVVAAARSLNGLP